MNIMLGIFSVAATAGTYFLLKYFILENRKDRIPVLIYHRVVSDEDLLRCRKSS